MRYKLVAIDDEQPALDLIGFFTDKLENIEPVKLFSDAEEGLEFLKQNLVDIVLLDINMPGINGLKLKQMIDPSIKVIFATAHMNYAFAGFELSAVDYLLKPYSFDRYRIAIEKAINLIVLESGGEKEVNEITIKINYKNRSIVTDRIKYVESLNNNIIIHLYDGEMLSFRASLSTFISSLPSDKFLRIHRSYIIPIERVTAYNKQSVVIDDVELPLSEKYKDDFLNVIR